MAGQAIKADIAVLGEKCVSLDSKIRAAHTRLDKYELDVKEDLKGIAADVKDMSAKIDGVTAFTNRAKGYIGALILLSAFLGGSTATNATGTILKFIERVVRLQ